MSHAAQRNQLSSPKGAIARALHAITLLIAHQMVRDLRELGGKVDVFTVPNLCPLHVSPYDFSRADQLIEQAAEHTRKWIEGGGLSRPENPNSLLPHSLDVLVGLRAVTRVRAAQQPAIVTTYYLERSLADRREPDIPGH